MIIAGDLGGTKCDLAAYELEHGNMQLILKQRLVNAEFKSFAEAISYFWEQLGNPKISGLAVAIAAPICPHTDVVRLTNRNWEVSRTRLKDLFKVKEVYFLNDLEAQGYGINYCPDIVLENLNMGVEKKGNKAVIAVGTGLGQAVLFWDGHGHIPSASEGGHVSFAPQDFEELDLLKFAMEKFGHVSAERLISGHLGLPVLTEFYASKNGYDRYMGRPLEEVYQIETFGRQLFQAYQSGDEIAQYVFNRFIKLLAAEAANLALKVLPYAGLYVSGGIAGKILPLLRKPEFMAAFTAKGRFSELLQTIPIHVIMDQEVGLKGAGRFVLKKAQLI